MKNLVSEALPRKQLPSSTAVTSLPRSSFPSRGGRLLFIKIGFSLPYDKSSEVAEIKWDEGIKIAFSEYGVVCGDGKNKHGNSNTKAPNAQDRGQGEDDHSHKFEGVADLVVLLCKICDCNERHIEDNVTAEPTYLHGKIAEDQRTHDR